MYQVILNIWIEKKYKSNPEAAKNLVITSPITETLTLLSKPGKQSGEFSHFTLRAQVSWVQSIIST